MSETKTSKARSWNFPTSPRSPYKLQGELRLLKSFDGKISDVSTQIEFAKELAKYSGFEGTVSSTETAFSARDRLRGPRLLGFICTPKRGEKLAKLEFTEIGNIFLDATEDQQEMIFLRQIAKVQYHSYLHDIKGFEDMDIRPMMLMIKMLLSLGKMSKEEIALFALTTTDHKKIDLAIRNVNNYREEINKRSPGIERKTFKKEFAEKYVSSIYAEDISHGRTKVREGNTDFINTKLRTLKDYADSTIRYLRATGIFTVLPHGQSLTLTNARTEDAKFLLNEYGTSALSTSKFSYRSYVKDYLGNPSLPVLRIDNESTLTKDIESKIHFLQKSDKHFASKLSNDFNRAKSSAEKINTLILVDKKLTEIQIKNQAKEIREDFRESLSSITEMYEGISSKEKDIVDRPLMYEWNTWRSMVLINDALNVQGNYHADADGNPVSTASGNGPDIICEYDSFWLAVEVTLQSGMKQYEAEGESIIRHIGNLQKEKISSNDSRPVYGLFVAEKINPEVVSHLFSFAVRKSQVYQGSVRILPIERKNFNKMMVAALNHSNFNHSVLHDLFSNAFALVNNDVGELDWFHSVQTMASQLSTSCI